MFDTIGQHISLAKSTSSQSLGLDLSIHDQWTWTELNFIDNNIYIITKLLAPATSKMTNRGGGKGYTFTTREKLNTTN